MAVMLRIRERLKQAQRIAELASSQRAGAHARRLVRRRRKEVLREHWYRFAVLLGIGIASMAAAHFFLPGWGSSYVVGALAVGTIWLASNALHWMDGMANQRLGIAGEELTTDELRKLRRHGWFFVNHVMLEKGDVDHAVVGPGGFFAIDSKYRTDWTRAQDSLRGIAGAVRWQADQLQRRIQMKTPVVRPLVVLWGPQSKKAFAEPFERDGVIFCHGTSLIQTLQGLEPVVSSADVEQAFSALDRYVARRDLGEARQHGDLVRPIADHLQDVMLATFFTGLSFFVFSLTTAVPPAGVWALTVALGVAVLSGFLRRRSPKSDRVQRVTAATLATSVGWGSLMIVVIVVNLFW